MKIKVRPEDFVVQELSDIALAPEGQYRVYLLHKRGWNTADAIGAFARAVGVPASEVRYAGLKDRHALTSQFISIPRRYCFQPSVPGINPADLLLEHLGFSDDFVSTKNLRGNSFQITLRSLGASEADSVALRADEVGRAGFPNYFDDQRFGSVPLSGEFIAERVVNGHLKGALKTYLTGEFAGQPAEERKRRQAVSEAWGDWPAVLGLCRSGIEKRIVGILQQGGNKKNLLLAVNAIPRGEMIMYVAAFQSAVWNGCLRALLGGDTAGVPSVTGKAGDYLFPGAAALEEIRSIQIPTVARQILPCSPAVQAAIAASLGERGLAASDFGLRGIHTAYFKSFYRLAVVVPEDLKAGETAPDELYAGRKKLVLRFSLPKGSYATMLLKALSLQESLDDVVDEGLGQ